MNNGIVILLTRWQALFLWCVVTGLTILSCYAGYQAGYLDGMKEGEEMASQCDDLISRGLELNERAEKALQLAREAAKCEIRL